MCILLLSTHQGGFTGCLKDTNNYLVYNEIVLTLLTIGQLLKTPDLYTYLVSSNCDIHIWPEWVIIIASYTCFVFIVESTWWKTLVAVMTADGCFNKRRNLHQALKNCICIAVAGYVAQSRWLRCSSIVQPSWRWWRSCTRSFWTTFIQTKFHKLIAHTLHFINRKHTHVLL